MNEILQKEKDFLYELKTELMFTGKFRLKFLIKCWINFFGHFFAVENKETNKLKVLHLIFQSLQAY